MCTRALGLFFAEVGGDMRKVAKAPVMIFGRAQSNGMECC